MNLLLQFWIGATFLFLPLFASANLELYTDKATAYYRAGEEMEFLIESDDNDPIEYRITYGDFADDIQTGIITDHTPGELSKISFTLNQPGFVYCYIDQDGDKEMTAVAFSPNDIQPSLPEPSDFDQFWQAQKEALAAIPIDANLSFEEEDEFTKSFSIDLGFIDNRRVYGFISIPKTEGPFPASLRLPPFGSSSNIVSPDSFTAERAGMIAMYISIHNAEPGDEDPNAYDPNIIDDREKVYYRYGILAAIRAIDYIFTREDFDGENLCLFGDSQGAGLSLLASGIDERPTLLLQGIAALAGHSEFDFGKAAGFPYYMNYSNTTVGTAEHLQGTLEATAYYDAVYAASRFTGPSYNFISYQDETCPPATGYAAFNQLPGPKIMVHSFNLDHSNPSEYNNARYDFFRRHFEATQNPPWPYTDFTQGYYVDAGAPFSIPLNEEYVLNGSYDKNGDFDLGYEVEWSVVKGNADKVIFSDPNVLNPKVVFTAAGDYKLRLIITDPYDEDDEIFYQLIDYLEVIVTMASSAEENWLQNEIVLSPNPARDYIEVNCELPEVAVAELFIFNELGKKIFETNTKRKIIKERIDTQLFLSGNYFIEIRSDGKTEKVIFTIVK